MNDIVLSPPKFGFIVATRAAAIALRGTGGAQILNFALELSTFSRTPC